MKAKVEIIGYCTTLTNGDTYAEVELPGKTATMGEILVELGKRYDEKYNTLVVNPKDHVILQVAMMDGKIITYDTPIPDGATTQLTVIMDGGC
jgi:hypothetical protein